MSNFANITNTKLEEVKSKLDGLPSLISGFDTHESKTSAQHLSEMKNSSVRGINNTGGIGDGSENHTSVALGYDRSGGQGRALLVDSNGTLQTFDNEVWGKASQIANQTTLSNANEATLIANQTNETQTAKCMGINGTTQVQLGLEANGSLVIGGGAVKTGIDSGGSTQHILVDGDGHLQVDVLSGGGGSSSSTQSSSNANSTSGALKVYGSDNSTAFIDTNGGNKFMVTVQCVASSSGSFAVEWSDTSSFTTFFVCNGFTPLGADIAPKTLTSGVTRVDSSTVTNQALFQFETIPARYARVTAFQSVGTVEYVVKTYISP